MHEIMTENTEKVMAIDVFDEKEKVMTRDQNWDFSVRVIGNINKKVEFFIKVKTVVD